MERKKTLCEEIAGIINIAVEIVWFFRQQYFFRGQCVLKKLIAQLQENLPEISRIAGMDFVNRIGLMELLDAQEQDDEILAADILEAQFLPCMEQLIQELQQELPIEQIDFLESNLQILAQRDCDKLVKQVQEATAQENCAYNPEYTASGQVTIRISEGGRTYYVSGNNNPYRDALSFIQGNMDPNQYHYVMLGVGMLWELDALLLQRPDAEVVVIEEDTFLLKMALQYRDLATLLSDKRVSMECCAYEEYLAKMDLMNCCILIRKPAMRHMQNQDFRMTLERYFVKSMTIKEQAYVLEREYRQNIKLGGQIRSVEECRGQIAGKTVYLVAGGPSLNKTLHILEKRDSNSVIVSVGTAAAVLKKTGIVPDFVIITDVGETIFRQLNHNVDTEKTALWYMISANAKAVASFDGAKYAIFQNGFDLAENYAKQHGYMQVSTGGSVSTTALDVCIRLGCERVICLGLDLAYTDNKTHASGTVDYDEVKEYMGMPMVKSVAGDMIPTSLNLSCYHKWIERRIADEAEIDFINVSNGAYISGMQNYTPQNYSKAFSIKADIQ